MVYSDHAITIMFTMGLIPFLGMILLFFFATMMESEKIRIIILGLIEVLLLVIFYGVVDPIMGGDVVRYQEFTDKVRYWHLMPVMYGLVAIGVAIGSLLGDFHEWTDEDYYGAFLLVLTPFLLVVGGLMDWLSASVIQWHHTGVFAKDFPFFHWQWWWLDKWSLPYYISLAFGYEHTQGFTLPIGIIITLVVLAILWIAYYVAA
jgi:hypothetical protein